MEVSCHIRVATYDRVRSHPTLHLSPHEEATMTVEPGARLFDLNIERVLEHWTVAHAVREIIANALDEQILSGTEAPSISKDASGDWHVRDHGRGLRYEHLTQNENKEKLSRSAEVIGKFGVELKD